MTDGLWNQLPAELLERVLSIFPVPDLCRLRSVCKMWNSLICSPAFGKECVSKGASTGAFFVVNLHVRCPTAPIPLINRLSMFDLNAKRWYNFEHELPVGCDYDVPAMDGGLVCKFVASLTAELHRQSIRMAPSVVPGVLPVPQTLIIFNLCGGTFKALPAPPLRDIHMPSMNLQLFVESMSNTYKIFLLNPRSCVGEPWMCVYGSSANQWRTLSSPPTRRNGLDVHVRSVMFQGLLYVLIYRPAGSIDRLYSFNYLEDAWEDTRVQFRHDKVGFCDLVVSDNRLFLMTQHLVGGWLPDLRRNNRPGRYGWALDICEIQLADKVCRTVVQMGDAEVCEKFGIDPDVHGAEEVYLLKIRAFGFDKSILLMCLETGNGMLYDLVAGAWESWHQNPAERQHIAPISNGQPGHIFRIGLQMSYLRLPTAPW